MRSPRSATRTIAAVAIGLVAALVLAEALLRLTGFEFALHPTRIQFGWPDPVTLEERYEVDDELFWVPRDYRAKVLQSTIVHPSIVFMGDSCTELGRYDDLFRAYFEERHPGSDLDLANVGVAGWSTYQGALQLERDVVPMHPRIVTIYYGWNDHWNNFGIEDGERGRLDLDPTGVRVLQLVDRVRFAMSAGDARGERVPLPDFSANLTRMVRAARAAGIVPVLVTAPSSHRRGQEPEYLRERYLDDLEQLVPLHTAYVEAVREVGAAEGVAVLDLHRAISGLRADELDPLFLEDGIHLTPQGNQLIAELLYECLLENDLLTLLEVESSR